MCVSKSGGSKEDLGLESSKSYTLGSRSLFHVTLYFALCFICQVTRSCSQSCSITTQHGTAHTKCEPIQVPIMVQHFCPSQLMTPTSSVVLSRSLPSHLPPSCWSFSDATIEWNTLFTGQIHWCFLVCALSAILLPLRGNIVYWPPRLYFVTTVKYSRPVPLTSHQQPSLVSWIS